jgi:hypothetical protein
MDHGPSRIDSRAWTGHVPPTPRSAVANGSGARAGAAFCALLSFLSGATVILSAVTGQTSSLGRHSHHVVHFRTDPTQFLICDAVWLLVALLFAYLTARLARKAKRHDVEICCF